MYGVVRASARAPIQSGPVRLARCLGRKGTLVILAVLSVWVGPVLAGGPACLAGVRGLDRSLGGRARACLGPRACARARGRRCLPAQARIPADCPCLRARSAGHSRGCV